MKHGFLKVAAGSPQVWLGNPQKNAKEILRLATIAEEQGASVIAFPELCLTGYSLGDLFLQSTLREAAISALCEIKQGSKKLDCVLVVGLPLALGGSVYDCAAIVCRGEVCGIVPKQIIAEDQTRVYAPWDGSLGSVLLDGEEVSVGQNLLFDLDGATFAVELGNEVLSPISPAAAHVCAGADFVVNSGALRVQVTRAQYLTDTVKNLSGRLACGYIYAGAGEGESTTDAVYAPQLIICENGDVLEQEHSILHCDVDLVITDLDIDRIRAERLSRRMGSTADGYLRILLETGGKDATLHRRLPQSPFIPQDERDKNARFQEIFDIQAAALKARLHCVHTDKAVVAVSGGLDSTLALLVTVRALDAMGAPRENLTAVTMPGFGTTDRTYDNAMNLMQKLGLTVREIPIRDACIQHFAAIGHDLEIHNAVYENGQARERTQIAMDIANQVGGIQVGTGDLSELVLGWATYGGDHMSMYGVNGSIPKTLMQHMVRYVAGLPAFAEVKDTLVDIVETPISPELLPLKDGKLEQKTEGIVGPYELHDFFLFYLLRYGYSPKKIYFMACHAFDEVYEKAVIKQWLVTFLKRFFAQQFKRSCLPDGPAVGSVGISPRGGWMVPTDAMGTIWVKEAEELE